MPKEQDNRRRDGTFGPGNRAGGKPKGARHRTTLAIEALFEGEHEELARAAIEKAKAGDVQALRLCLERLAPPRRDAVIAVDLPEVGSAADAKAASTAVLKAVSSGEITPSEGAAVMGLLVSHKLIIEATDFEARLAALEGKQ